MSNTRNTGFLTNVVKYTDKGDISFVSGSTTLMSISSSGAVTVTGVISGSNALSSSYAVNADQLDNLDSTSFVFTSSFNTYSSSMSTRVANTESTGSTLTTASGSFSSRVGKIEGNYATTGSNVFLANQTVCANITSTGTIVAQTLNVQQVTSSIVYSSGSNIFGCSLTNTQQFTGSVFVTGSTLNVNGGAICATQNMCIGGMGIVASCIGINTTTPAQRLDIGSGHIKLSDGYGLFYGTQTQVYASEASKYVRFDIAGTSGVVFLTGSGNVGIGTTTPGNKLSVSDSTSNYISVDRTSNNYRLLMGAETFQTAIYSRDAVTPAIGVDLRFVVGTTEAMRISGSNANVGIGTSSPSFRLDVMCYSVGQTVTVANFASCNYNCGCQTYIQIGGPYSGGDGSSRIGSISPASNCSHLVFETHTTTSGLWCERMRITAAGDVLIGRTGSLATSTTTSKLVVGGPVNLGSGVNNTSFPTKDDGGLGVYVGSGANAFQVWDDNQFSYPRFIVQRAGNVGIGTSSPGYALEVCANVADWTSRFYNASATGNGLLVRVNNTSTSTTAFGVYNGQYIVSVLGSGVTSFACQVCAPTFIGSSIITFTGLPTSDQTTACRSIEGLWSLASNRSCATKAGQYGNGTWYVQGGTNAGCWIYYKFAIQNPVWFRAYVYLVNYSDTSLRKGCMQYSLDNSGTWTDMANATNWQYNGTLDGNVSLSGDTKIITVRWDSGGSGNLVGWNIVQFTGCGSAFYSINGLG